MSNDAKIIIAVITVGIALGGFAMSSFNARMDEMTSSFNARMDKIESDIRELRSLHLMAAHAARKTVDETAATTKD